MKNGLKKVLVAKCYDKDEKEYLIRLFKKDYFYVAKIFDNKTEAGCLRFSACPNCFSDLDYILIQPKYARKGLASSVLKFYENYLTHLNITNISGICDPLNEADELEHIIKFYQKNGYTISQKNDKYYLSKTLPEKENSL